MNSTLVAANWKMNLPPEGIVAYASRVAEGAPDHGVSLLVAPPHPFLAEVSGLARERGGGFAVSAQNCHELTSGAYTGEVSAEMVLATGATWTIVGHSERRRLFGESDELVGRKAAAALRAGLSVILCIGEDETERERGKTVEVVQRQLERAFSHCGGIDGTLVIAYEPVWAIGTGKSATPDMVAETHGWIRGILEQTAGVRPILYGGSVKPDNATDLAAVESVGGFLVGGASLSSEKFLAIAAAFSRG